MIRSSNFPEFQNAVDIMDLKENWIDYIQSLQNNICRELETLDGKSTFVEDAWQRTEGGGGRTRVIQKGRVFEKGGVNISIVYGDVTEIMRSQLKITGEKWFACGLSLVLHPANPYVPTVHCNYRMFELYNSNGALSDRWFGGGTDLTPFYLFEEDARHFHKTYKEACDKFDPEFYPKFKKECDDYFVNLHRNNERRGIGGIFFDYQRADSKYDDESWFNFSKNCGDSFIKSYVPIVQKRDGIDYNEQHKYWQEMRRGRYVEFNLVYDRGTLFGLKTGGRTESILMSLPPTARFVYDHQPETGSPEAELLEICLHPRDWV